MDYKSWKYRGINFFLEEIEENDSMKANSYPSIESFKDKELYDENIRSKVFEYLSKSAPIVSTTFKTRNAYTKEYCNELTYFTDGEFLFTNMLKEYVKFNDFVLPNSWFEIIKSCNYKLREVRLNYDLIINGTVDVFKTFEETFDIEPSLKGVVF